MSVTIKGHKFEGPFSNTDSLRDSQGVYAILDGPIWRRYSNKISFLAEVFAVQVNFI